MYSAYCYEFKIGKLVIAENSGNITHIYFGENIPEYTMCIETYLIKRVYEELEEYFSGTRKVFDIPLAPQGTEFQGKVWRALQNIPYGETCSYKYIAESIGNAKAYRAVGMANNKNPIAIIIPCHRVIGSNGDLIGYAGGLGIKKKLLDMEKKNS
ncbi:methylated-DNA--[protein]-cysteine S-methyltransferase [Clostridium sp. LBM24168]